jgi:hypothetical protein
MEPLPKRPRGGRPKSDPAEKRGLSLSVRLSENEAEALKQKATLMGLTPTQYMREASLSRRLPSPPVPAINREEYAALARLAANLNQLTKLANEGRSVVIAPDLLKKLIGETKSLRLALLGVEHDRQSG